MTGPSSPHVDLVVHGWLRSIYSRSSSWLIGGIVFDRHTVTLRRSRRDDHIHFCRRNKRSVLAVFDSPIVTIVSGDFGISQSLQRHVEGAQRLVDADSFFVRSNQGTNTSTHQKTLLALPKRLSCSDLDQGHHTGSHDNNSAKGSESSPARSTRLRGSRRHRSLRCRGGCRGLGVRGGSRDIARSGGRQSSSRGLADR